MQFCGNEMQKAPYQKAKNWKFARPAKLFL